MRVFRTLAMAGALLLPGAVVHAEQDRVAELERKLEILAREIEDLKLGAVADTAAYPSRFGLGPGASKVYGGRGVSIGGYGEMLYENFDRRREDGALSGLSDRIDYLRQVVYLGFKFSDELLFNSEIEVEHGGIGDEAEVEVDPSTGIGGAELTGEVKLEFAYVEWTRHRSFGVRGGMLLIPVGHINELHEPPVFLGARRPEVEQRILPATWSGNGAGVFGQLASGLAYRAYVVEGLDAGEFSALGGIRGGRQGGSRSRITKPAFTGRLDFDGVPGLVVGASGFTGDSWQAPQPAGSRLTARVTLVDTHARYQWRGLEARALYAGGRLQQAGELSDALGLAGAERLGERFSGYYFEAAYDLLQALRPGSGYRFLPYARFERYDTQNDVPGGSEDPAAERRLLTLGAAFQPHPNVVLKADRQLRSDPADTGTDQWNIALGYVF